MGAMIRTLIDHTIDDDPLFLPERPIVLDAGCRGFGWTREILQLRPGARVIALDPDPKIDCPADLDHIQFMRMAITEKSDRSVVWQGPGEGSYICGKPGDPGYGWAEGNNAESAIVKNTTIGELMIAQRRQIERWDVVKLDIEGSEFGILENWPGPIALQISVEFHDFIDRKRWGDAYFDKLFGGPLRFYDVRLFQLTPIGPANSLGHWDSLLTLKEDFMR
jgi:FkbM family methyltransferase